jgi:hypothetical protein
MEDRRPYRSFFWPILLIGIGVIWLLGNMNLIPAVSLGVLFRLWPILLIVAGLDLLFGRFSPVIGAVIGLLAVAAIVVLLFAAPALGLPAAPEVVTEQFTEPIGQATSATILLDLSSPRTTISALSNSENLLDATLQHLGNARLTSSGVENRRLSLSTVGTTTNWFDVVGSGPRRWDIGLSPSIPMELTIDSGSGGGDFDLSGLMLTRLSIDSGSGSIELDLPDSEDAYEARINSGSGSVRVDVPCSNIELRMDSGSGSIQVNVPADCPLRVEVLSGGSGSVNLPNSLDQVRGDNDEGEWQSSDYSSAAERLLIIMEDQGSGSFSVR